MLADWVHRGVGASRPATADQHSGAGQARGSARGVPSHTQSTRRSAHQIASARLREAGRAASERLSSEFQATPGLGKISLEWKGEELTDR